MDLVSLKLEGFRRFEDDTTIDLAGSPIAFIGPNEAGKSSVLDALVCLNKKQSIQPRQRTRAWSGNTSITAIYLLNDADRQAISHIDSGSEVRSYTYQKWLDTDGKTIRWYEAYPSVRRKLDNRQATKAKLESITENEDIRSKFQSAGDQEVSVVLKAAIAALASNKDSLTPRDYHTIKQFPTVMRLFSQVTNGESDGISVTDAFRHLLDELDSYDEGPSPEELVDEILLKQIPQTLKFTGDDRDLHSTYDLNEVISNPPRALQNLTRLAGIDLARLNELQTSDDRAGREDYLDEANSRLAQVFETAWGQSKMTVRLRVQGSILELMVTTPEGKNSLMEDRSDGLRAFVALRGFLDAHPTDVPPILVVDEAETHLHYDAQAELVELFTEQKLASKIVYTTHSVGCLPRDLGTGVRVIEPIAGLERSRVRKSIWDDTIPGFRPLLIGLGAATFGFLPARKVLFGEGPTDAMLYPTLFREVMGVPYLDFQIASGISSIKPERVRELLEEGGIVAFLTDGDKDGVRYRDDLEAAGIPVDQMFGLDTYFAEGTVIEDLVGEEVFCEAVRAELSNLGHATLAEQLPALPQTNRPKTLADWCKAQKVVTPSKSRLAQRLLDLKSEAHRSGTPINLVDDNLAEKVKALGVAVTQFYASNTNSS